MELREAVDGGGEELGPRVLEAVPGGVVGGVAEAEVRAEVDDRLALVEELVDPRRDRPVGEGEEHGLGVVGHLVEHLEPGRHEARVEALDRVAVALASHEAGDLDVRVAREEPDQLRAHVPRRADDRDPDGVAVQCAGPPFGGGRGRVGGG